MRRAVSEVLGYVLVFSLVVVTVAMVTVGGVGQLENARDAEQLNNAERAFDLLAANVEDVALGGAPSRATEISLADAQIQVADPVEFTFRGVYAANGTDDFNETYSVWPITYRTDAGDTDIVYSGGGVFRTDRQGGLVTNSPSVVAADDRIVVPLLITRSRSAQGLGDGTIRVRVEHANTDLLAADDSGVYDRFFMNVTSPRAELWADELGDHEEFSCTLDTTGSVDRAWCEATASPLERVHVTLIQMDVELSS